MNTIVLFHRLELTDLFAPVGQALAEKNCRIVHLAYSQHEANRLRELGVTGDITIFKDEIRRLHPQSRADDTTLQDIDRLFIEQSGGAFNLNGAIQSDRGYSLLSLDEAQQLTITYVRFWREFLDRYQARVVVHETCSLMFNFVAAMLCAQRGGHYLYAIMAQGPGKGFQHLLMSGFDFSCPDLDHTCAAVDAGRLPVDATLGAEYLVEFRKSFNVFLGGAFKRPSLASLAAKATAKALLKLVQPNRLDRVLDNIDYWQATRRSTSEKVRNLRRYSSEVQFDTFDPDKRFYFYPLHLEPEAVVLYHAHGFYTNQIKLIQNIAAQLPPGVYLYVKDHPHDHGYRSADDYLALKSVPNIRLIDTSVSGKQITAKSLGVITLTGTAGFEALLLGKQVYTFAKTFYSQAPGVVRLDHIRQLRAALYAAADRAAIDDNELHRYLTAYFAALHPGLTDYFAGRAQRYGIDLDANARQVAAGIFATLQGQR